MVCTFVFEQDELKNKAKIEEKTETENKKGMQNFYKSRLLSRKRNLFNVINWITKILFFNYFLLLYILTDRMNHTSLEALTKK